MSKPDPDEVSRQLAARSLANDDPTGWFEVLYRAAEAGETQVPWERKAPNALLAEWVAGSDGHGKRAIVIGFGTGQDSEFIASIGYDTTAFEVAATAVSAARRHFPNSRVDYVEADLLALPAQWIGRFELVVECLTVQSLPRPLRAQAIAAVVSLLAPGGRLIVVATSIDPAGDLNAGPPWPLTEAEIGIFCRPGITVVRQEHLSFADDPGFGRWRIEFARESP
ncbi:class I SAM-dependent methyltransferase [Mesorhizobium sp. M1C.F.Ca.ET.193.01.1.1]|uniref:class I SAM-dependent methyltransferase n=2 Tax=Mesorhizobium TaxID=68287 RepID=UPI000FD2063E|nr:MULTISPECIES: class I SAM-dependent methyltransferase [unclassified Mesorhizobium]TGT01411.1 class I SAM-dependent methyltransferase [bacterium M00.F.Ca.ET.177.01.1.1]TGQ54170.1 class I SAM-dependent methyltransferase [Mesorhizobium sp. M1C.F.Ca.ET.210.01.1.1]TGQ72183.1 class I SAM-dependent methyltransferase [Mesorhizobium sp. M1C.F.Ca.ET.212.01.1.1]TGR09999.1 class I SAM-dependent methyltransferase [Mesorhizobium sp. M1C.F.Ca.ET.204.01.1.1]TGR30119.1 class I SAM-dependent methyltransferas